MELKIEITEQDIAERKKIWIDSQLQQYMGLDYWKRSATQDELLAEIRTAHQIGSKLYLTKEFKAELQETLREQVSKLVEEELKRSKQSLKEIVQQFLFEKLDALVQETLKDSIFTTTSDYNNQQ